MGIFQIFTLERIGEMGFSNKENLLSGVFAIDIKKHSMRITPKECFSIINTKIYYSCIEMPL